jgi:hypothetical protein
LRTAGVSTETGHLEGVVKIDLTPAFLGWWMALDRQDSGHEKEDFQSDPSTRLQPPKLYETGAPIYSL